MSLLLLACGGLNFSCRAYDTPRHEGFTLVLRNSRFDVFTKWSVQASNGYKFPPCIIIERGESLEQWAKREEDRDFVTTLQVLHHVATRLQMLHKAGWAHLDLCAPLGPSCINFLTSAQQHSGSVLQCIITD